MATITSAKSGDWSDATVWSGGVPANGDTVIIQSSHTVNLDVDQSGFASGITLTLNGTLTASRTVRSYLKLAGNLAGTGKINIGSEASPIPALGDGNPYTCVIGFNGAYKITSSLSEIKIYGEVKTLNDTLAQGQVSGDSTIVLTNGLTLRAGDVLVISNSNSGQQGNTCTTHTVSSYNAGNRTVTLTTTLGQTVNANDGVGIITCSCRLTNIGKAANTSLIVFVNNGILYGVQLYNFGRAPIDSGRGWTISNCVGYNNINGGISCYGSNTISNCVGYNNIYGGISCYGSNMISNCTSNNTNTNGSLYNSYSSELYSCNFTTSPEVVGYTAFPSLQSNYIQSINHNQVPGAFKAWTNGGITVSCVDPSGGSEPGWRQMICESGTSYIYYQYEHQIQPNEWLYVDAKLRKDTSMSYFPRVQIIDKYSDPLANPSNSPLSEVIMPSNDNDVTMHVACSYFNSSTIGKKVLVRVIAKNATGNVYAKVRRTGGSTYVGDLL